MPGPSDSPGQPGAPQADGGRLATNLRGFGPLGVLVALVVVALGSLGGIPVLVWAHFSRTPWRDLGFVRPRNWLGTVVLGIVFGVALKFLMKMIAMPLLGAPAANPTYHFLVGNQAALPGMIATVIFRAGFGEETVFRGFLFERFGRLLGRGAGARSAIVLLGAALFALAHIPDQGLAGAEQAAITGLVFGTIFTFSGQLWMPMAAHIAFDLTAVAMIYWNLESYVAHLVFR